MNSLKRNAMYYLCILFFILLCAFFLRTYDISHNPPGLYIDEVSSAYNAYSIMKTGRDEHGTFFPIYFKAFGEYRHGFYVYSMIPSLFIFGLNDFGTRFTSVIFGMLSIAALYFCISRMFNKYIGLLSAGFLAIQPWHMHLSRVAFEGISFIFLFLMGLLFFYKAIHNREQQIWMYASTFFFALCIYSYGVAKLFIPLFLVGMIIIYKEFFFTQEHRKMLLFCFLLFVVLVSPLYLLSFFKEGNARFQQGSIFTLSGHPFFTFIFNYISHYTSTFLFFNGDDGLRHHLHEWGFLFPGDIVWVLAGLFFVILHRNKKECHVLLLWLALFPLAASFMYGDTPHGLRSFIGSPLFAIFSAIGIAYIWKHLQNITNIHPQKQRICILVFVLLVVGMISIQTLIYYKEYFTEYKVYSYDYWMAYIKPMLDYTASVRNEYEHVYFSANSMERIPVYILYYFKIEPATYFHQGFENATGYRICNMNECFNEDEHNLYVFRGFELAMNGTHHIYYPDNTTIAVKFVG